MRQPVTEEEVAACTVDRWPHAYLVHGTTRIDVARDVMDDLGLDPDYPCMPITFRGEPCVAMYFHASGDPAMEASPREHRHVWSSIPEGKP